MGASKHTEIDPYTVADRGKGQEFIFLKRRAIQMDAKMMHKWCMQLYYTKYCHFISYVR